MQRPRPRLRPQIGIMCALFSATAITNASAQDFPWDVFEDTQSNSLCDVVNAANGELVVLSNTGQLVIVTGSDVTLQDTFVTQEGDVLFEGLPAGFIDYQDDGDGLRTLWWIALTGQVVSVDGFTGEPTPTEFFPSDFESVPCDACEFWDDRSICEPSPDPDPPPIVLNICGTSVGIAMLFTFLGLTSMRWVGRRYV